MKMTSKVNHVTAWIRKDLKGQLATAPLLWAESCYTRPGTQNPAQAGLEHFQREGTYKFSGKKTHDLSQTCISFYVNSFLLCIH